MSTLPGDPGKPYTDAQRAFLAAQADSFRQLAAEHTRAGNQADASHFTRVADGLKADAERAP